MARPWNCLLGKVNWGIVSAVFISLMTWFVACASAQNQETCEPDKPCVVTELKPGKGVRALWDKVVACSGPARDTTQTYEQIKWFSRPPGFYLNGSLIKGQWIAPDTIYLTAGYEKSGFVVAHEMLHHALNGPPGEDKHPPFPFMFPCRLQPYQQVPGGIMVPPSAAITGSRPWVGSEQH